MTRSPTLEGFRAVFRQPSLALAEIAWRWSCGAAGVVLLTLGFVEYLDTLPVSPADVFLLRTRHPILVGRALQHIVRGSALRMLQGALLLGLGFVVAWVVVAALGRAATVKALVGYFAEQSSQQNTEVRSRLRPLVALNSLRAAVTLAGVIGGFGAILLGGAASSNDDPSPANSIVVFIMVAALGTLAWLVLNWFLSLASVFAVAEGEDTFGAMALTADFCRRRGWPVLAGSFWFGAAHCGSFVIASVLAILVLSFLTVLPGFVVVVGLALVTLLYFAVADSLYVARLAAYLYIAIGPEAVGSPALKQDESPRDPALPAEDSLLSRIDTDELILSDLSPIS